MKSNLFGLALMFFAVMSVGSLSHATDRDEISACLDHWGKTPFSEKSEYRVISGKVKVMGIGGNIVDDKQTKSPELVLVRPTVSVMSKTLLNLNNPNGWYCLKGEVAVLGKMQINLGCHAHLASSKGGTTVLGSDDQDTGVTVLGSTNVTRVGCAGGTAHKAKEDTEKTAKE